MLGGQLFGPGGDYHSRILDRWAANPGRREGAIADPERRPLILRLAALNPQRTGFQGHKMNIDLELGSRLCARSAGTSAPMRDWSRPSVIFERFPPWSRVACAIAH